MVQRCGGWLAILLLVFLSGCQGSSTDTMLTPNQRADGRVPESSRMVLKSSDAIEVFKTAGLDVASVRPMTREDYGFAPLVAKEGSRFLIASLGQEKGGRVMSFDNQTDLEKIKGYYDGLAKESAALFSHTFVQGNLLLQINGEMADSEAAKYGAALQTLK